MLDAERFAMLKSHKPTLIGLENTKRFSVCIPLLHCTTGWEVLFEVRSERIGRQPGDICFPGGALEPGEDPLKAAVRETVEELLVEKEQLEILGLMDLYLTNGNNLIYPYAAILQNYQGSWSRAEVKETFTVPLDYFLETEPDVYYTRLKVEPEDNFPYEDIRGGRNYPWRRAKNDVYFYRYGDRIIWGITARILKSFTEIYKNEPADSKA